MSTPQRSPAPSPSAAPSTRALIGVIVAVPLLIGFVLWAFTWPNARSSPHDLPVGVAGPAQATAPAVEGLAAQGDAFDVREYPDEDAARRAIEERDIYGAFVFSGEGPPQVLTAGAGGASVSQLLVGVAEAQAPEGASVTVTDVVPAPDGDPRGTVFGTSLLPLVIAGIATGALIAVTGLRGGRALVGLVGAAALAGVMATVIGHDWLEVLAGDWWQVAGVLGLLVLAGGATVAGFAALLGQAGIGVGAVLLMLLGNPWSGATSAPEMLPEPVGALGQWLPTGAGASLLRSVAFFDGNGGGLPLAVLVGWALLGTAAILWGGRRRSRPAEDKGNAGERAQVAAGQG
ncbi:MULTISPECIES: ABC transporter permease family protein [Streptomyces]|uniref:ABC transporter permease n=1 Tax=Streptomyces TaxID=1883 RepID=UPI001D051716|nr:MULTISPECIES: ABC transporter permease [Streptomyces]